MVGQYESETICARALSSAIPLEFCLGVMGVLLKKQSTTVTQEE